MKTTATEYLMMLEPTLAPTAPINDELTALARLVYARTEATNGSRGWHDCTGAGCSAESDSYDHELAGVTTNSLLVHYVESHRAEIPEGEIAKLRALAAAPRPQVCIGGGFDRE